MAFSASTSATQTDQTSQSLGGNKGISFGATGNNMTMMVGLIAAAVVGFLYLSNKKKG